jgi:quaternary ammonium compound-resistance protein SugE
LAHGAGHCGGHRQLLDAGLGALLRVLPMGVAYAAWTGIGIMGTALVGAAVFHEALSAGQVVSLVLILAGIAGLKLFSS